MLAARKLGNTIKEEDKKYTPQFHPTQQCLLKHSTTIFGKSLHHSEQEHCVSSHFRILSGIRAPKEDAWVVSTFLVF